MDKLNREMREEQLAFIGRMMAGVSHDFKNHLAIIRELNGLIGDMLELEPEKSAKHARYKKIIGDIDERVERAAEMCRYLSGFSHRMDQALSSFSVNDVLREALFLLQRTARQKQVALDSSLGEELPAIFSDPALLQFACYFIIRPALESLAKDGRVLVSTSGEGGGIRITITMEGERRSRGEGPAPAPGELLAGLAQELNAQVSFRPSVVAPQEVVLVLPPQIAAPPA